ncbi:MAG: magnesium transporter CorA family protein [Candidatus Paceibacterota bacterium]|jgi:magnesium transporter
MITTRAFMGQVWLDLNSPSKEEADSLILTQNISPTIAKDLLAPTPTQYAEEDGENIYAVLHIPTFKNSHSAEDSQEIDFIIKADGVITARYGSIDALHYFAKRVEVSEILNQETSSHIFFEMLKEIYKGMTDELAYIEDWMKEIEKNIFDGQEKAMVFTISNAGRNLLNFKRMVDPHGNVFDVLAKSGEEKFGKKFKAEANNLKDDWTRLMKRVNNQMDLVTELRETNNSMLSTKQNEIMKNLAVIGSVLFPLTVIGQIFGMSIIYFPLKNDPNAFWIISSLMVIVMLSTLIYARVKKWF